MARLVVVSHFAAVRAGLRTLLADQPGLSLVGETPWVVNLGALLIDSCADMVLWDYAESELASMIEICERAEVRPVVLGPDRDAIVELVDSHVTAWAALPRDAEPEEIAGAVAAVTAGLVAMNPATLDLIADPSRATERAGEPLTPREQEILQLMAEGMPNKQIAIRLGISQHTVKFHAASLFAKLDAASRTEAVTSGIRRGLVLL